VKSLLLLSASLLAACAPSSDARPPPARSGSLTILYTADLHSHLFDEPLRVGAADASRGLGPEGHTVRTGGAARLASVLESLSEQATDPLYVDAGDLLEGTSVFTAFGGVPELRALSALGLAAAAAGNHDLSMGTGPLSDLLRENAAFPLLAVNLPDAEAAAAVVPSLVVEKNGVRVALIGVGRTPSGPGAASAVADAVNHAVSELSSADVRVVLSHLGREADLELVPRVHGVDAVIGGHSHDFLEPPALVLDCDEETARRYGCTSRRIPVVHTGAYGRYVGRIDVELSAREAVDFRFSTWPVSEPVPERADIVRLLEPFRRQLDAAGFADAIAFAPEVVSRSAPSSGDSALGNFVARAVRGLDSDLAVLPTSGIRADLPEGEVSRDDWARVLPFDDTVLQVTLSGSALQRALVALSRSACERGGGSPVQIDGATFELRCADVTLQLDVGGRTVSPGGTYRVASASFLRDMWGSVGARIEDAGLTVLDAILAYLGALPACDDSPLPCIDSAAGAAVDGRIRWK
jgi:5'-nucleotidase